MAIAFHHKPVPVGAHRRFWLVVAALLAFLFAVLWTQPLE